MSATFHCDHCRARFPAASRRAQHCPRCDWPLAAGRSIVPPASGVRAPPESRARLLSRVAPPAETCTECGCLLAPDERHLGGACAFFRCRAKVNARAANIFRETHEKRVAELVARVAGPAELPATVGFVPANERALVAIDDARRSALRAHLTEVVEDARGRGDPTPVEEQGGADPLLGQACGVCEGACCAHGAERAYLDARTLARAFQVDAPPSPEEVVDAYLSYVGDQGYDDSCIYHGPRGCTLPRAMRAEVCNTYLCPGIRTLANLLRRDGVRALVAAERDRRLVRLAIIDEREGTTRLPLP